MTDIKIGILVGLGASIFSSIIGLYPFAIEWWLCTLGIIFGFWIIWSIIIIIKK